MCTCIWKPNGFSVQVSTPLLACQFQLPIGAYSGHYGSYVTGPLYAADFNDDSESPATDEELLTPADGPHTSPLTHHPATLASVTLTTTVAGILRGSGRQYMGAAINFICYYIIGQPVGISLALVWVHWACGLASLQAPVYRYS